MTYPTLQPPGGSRLMSCRCCEMRVSRLLMSWKSWFGPTNVARDWMFGPSTHPHMILYFSADEVLEFPIISDSSVFWVMCGCGTITIILPSIRRRPAHCRSSSVPNGKPTTRTRATCMSRPVPAHAVPTKISAARMSAAETESLFLLVTTMTFL